MDNKKMKILIIEDDVNDYRLFEQAVQTRDDVEIVDITDSDIEGLNLVKIKRPEAIVLDLELNNSINGSTDSLDFLSNLKKLNLNYEPILIVTTHVNSKRTYEILHRNGVDLILYKDHPKYSADHVINSFLNLRKASPNVNTVPIKEVIEDEENKLINIIDSEMNLIGITSKLKGKDYIKDALIFLINNGKSQGNVTQYLTNKHKKSGNTITNGIQNAIIHAWRISPTEDLEKYYTARINYETGVPTPMEFLYYYADKIKKML